LQASGVRGALENIHIVKSGTIPRSKFERAETVAFGSLSEMATNGNGLATEFGVVSRMLGIP
jgi:hypothetical protein